jgi:hypothetical protein
MLDFEVFSKALRLRWLWFQFTDPDRPWGGTEVPCTEIDKQLFRACTLVIVGNGERARFWQDSWLDGRAPRDVAPNLYKLAWRKHNSVKEELVNQNWNRGLWRMATADEMSEFVILWGLLQDVQLSNQEDIIRWKWSRDGVYSAKSAYQVQFKGTYCTFNQKSIWRATTEGKHRLFGWLLVQNKILTADCLLARNWPCDPVCSLCDQEFETAAHICLQCVYAQQVWVLVSFWTDGFIHVPRLLKNGGTTLCWGSEGRTEEGNELCSCTRLGTSGKRGT